MAAYDLLLGEINAEIVRINGDGAAAFAAGELDRAGEILDRSHGIRHLLDELAALRESLADLVGYEPPATYSSPPSPPASLSVQAPPVEPSPIEPSPVEAPPPPEPPRAGPVIRLRETPRSPRADYGRVEHGTATPQAAYREPLLRALVEMGGRGRTADVIKYVYKLVKDQLVDADHDPVSSRDREPRWSNYVSWERNKLKEEGLLKSTSPRGIWEISEEGRRWLAREAGSGGPSWLSRQIPDES
jgi:hypothetical protein